MAKSKSSQLAKASKSSAPPKSNTGTIAKKQKSQAHVKSKVQEEPEDEVLDEAEDGADDNGDSDDGWESDDSNIKNDDDDDDDDNDDNDNDGDEIDGDDDGQDEDEGEGASPRGAKRAKKDDEDDKSVEKSRPDREGQKALLLERKAQKPNAPLVLKIKKLWERLRVKKLTAKERAPFMEEMMGLVTGKIHDIIFKHDASRIVQSILKYGTLDDRNIVAAELKGYYAELSKSQYGRFIVSKILNYCPKYRNNVITELYGNVRKLIRHRDASHVLEEAYSQFANAQQRTALIEEFYGPEFSIFKSKGSKSVFTIVQENPAKKPSIVKHLRESLTGLLEKGFSSIGPYTIVHRALLEYMQLTDEKGLNEMITLVKEHLASILHTREGSQVCQLVILHSTTKDRKLIIKSFKEYVIKISKEQYGHVALLTLFDSVDDTVLLKKAVVGELVAGTPIVAGGEGNLLDLAKDQYASRVLLFLLCGRNPKYQPAYIIKEMAQLDEVRAKTSKKDDVQRRAEMLEAISEPLIAVAVKNANLLIRDKYGSQVLLELFRTSQGDKAALIEAVAALVEGTGSAKQAEKSGEDKSGAASGEVFHPIKKLHAEATAAKKAQAEEGLDLDTHVFLHFPASRIVKDMIAGSWGGKKSESQEVSSEPARSEQSIQFARAVTAKIQDHIPFWIGQAAHDPHHTQRLSLILLALLETEDAEVHAIFKSKASKTVIAKAQDAIAASKQDPQPAASDNKKRKSGDRAAKKGAESESSKGEVRATSIEQFVRKIGEIAKA
ncbi:armadillo-type protein [Polychytrium aggregatum]|uniref:armadillo-type protein n=1 Tax=Polychytrium aggregatum TaxID=110093 RepID=UPI0022FE905B|nr:armadillo-type protein [Polychytrium aggregatum]KAI9203826.1 armadillo-type protein [Polychytrium aggregatum]